MKARDLYFVILKLLGLTALWYAIHALTDVISNPVFSTGLNFGISVVTSFILLFKTSEVMRRLRLDDDRIVITGLDARAVYHIVVICFGFIATIHGVSNSLEIHHYSQTTVTRGGSNDVANDGRLTNSSQHSSSQSFSNGYSFNVFSVAEIFVGLLILLKASKISHRISRKIRDE